MSELERYRAFSAFANSIMLRLTSEVSVCNGDKKCEFTALWDTGATITCISDYVVSTLGLIPVGMQTIQTPSGSKSVNTYLVDLQLPNNVKINNIPVCDSDIGKQGLGVLIGMDIITKGDFAVSNHNGKTVYSFRVPSKKTTDYVLEEKISARIGAIHGKGKRK